MQVKIIDRGEWFGAYYLSQTPNLFGQTWLNIFPCGSAVIDKITYGLYYLLTYKDINLGDSKGQFSEVFDMALVNSDEVVKSPLGNALLKNLSLDVLLAADQVVVKKTSKGKLPAEEKPPVDEKVKEKQVYKQKIQAEITKGTSKIEILEEQSELLTKEFVGFTFDEVLKTRPDLLQPVVDKDTGIETPNIWKCNLGPSVPS